MRDAKTPLLINNAAYQLIDAGLDLVAAEEAARSALAEMVQQSKNWSIDEDAEALVAKSRGLESTWDTVGWALYRDHKVDEAMDLIQPAWRNRQSPEVGTHLAEIWKESKDDYNAALRMDELALAAFPPYMGVSVRKTPTAKQQSILRDIASYSEHGPKLALDAEKELKRLRTVSLGDSGGLEGKAEYIVLMSGGKISKVRVVDDKALPGGSAGMLDRIRGTKVDGYWPKNSEATLAHFAELSCHAGSCELALER
jgi:hypothetical protein